EQVELPVGVGGCRFRARAIECYSGLSGDDRQSCACRCTDQYEESFAYHARTRTGLLPGRESIHFTPGSHVILMLVNAGKAYSTGKFRVSARLRWPTNRQNIREHGEGSIILKDNVPFLSSLGCKQRAEGRKPAQAHRNRNRSHRLSASAAVRLF